MIVLNDLTPEARQAEIDRIIAEDELDLNRAQVTLQDMDNWLARQSEFQDCYCPTCQTKMGRYKYTFDKSFLFTLIAMVKLCRDNLASIGVDGVYYEQIHHKVRDMLGKNNKNTRFRVMAYLEWGLIEKVSLDDYVYVNVDGRTERRKLGFFRVTDRGKVFLCGRLAIPKVIYVYNDNVYDVSKEKIKLSDVPDITNEEWEKMKKPF